MKPDFKYVRPATPSYIKPLVAVGSLILLGIAAGLAMHPANKLEAKAPVQEVVIERCIDGDTIQVEDIGSCRLAGIDAPETKGTRWPVQPHAEEAKRYLESITEGRKLQAKITKDGGFGRHLATIYEVTKDGGLIDLNAEMVAQGMAWAATEYSRRYLPLEVEARKAKLGIWKDHFPIEPSAWRRGKRL